MPKLSREKVIMQFKNVHGDKYDYSNVDYRNAITKVVIICRKHGPFEQLPRVHKRGSGCKKCNIELKGIGPHGIIKRNRKKPYSTKEVIEKFKRFHGDRYDYSKVEYTNAKSKVKIKCAIHGYFHQVPRSHWSGSGCLNCGYDSIADKSRLSKDEFIIRARVKHGDKYDYSLIEYLNIFTPVAIICGIHGKFSISPKNHIESGVGCPKCSTQRVYNQQEIVELFKEKHGNRYDYSRVNYLNSSKKVIIVCEVHGEFSQDPYSHRNGSGCPDCSNNSKYSREEMLQKFRAVHGNRYDYSNVSFDKVTDKVEIVCATHGAYFQIARLHAKGSGCPKCGNVHRFTQEEFILKCSQVHNNEYDYSQVVFGGVKEHINIICPIHGVFRQLADNHQRGMRCPTCARGWSKNMTLNFLDSIEYEHLRKMDSIELLTIINQGTLPDSLKEIAFTDLVSRESSISKLKERLLDEIEDDDNLSSIENDLKQSNEELVKELHQEDEATLDDVIYKSSQNDPTLISLTNNFDDLHALDNPVLESCDKEAIEFLIQYKLRRFWNKVLNNEIDIKAFRKDEGKTHFNKLKGIFFNEYDKVIQYQVPKGYSFAYSPNLMQKLTVYRIRKHRRYGNWSGTGAGKTVSFIIASREINSRLTVVVGLNSNVAQLGEDILDVFPNSKIYYNSRSISSRERVKYYHYRKGVKFDRSEYNYLILNYDKFQQGYSEKLFQDLTDHNLIDFVVIDEVHNVKQRTEEQESKRRATLKRLIGRASADNSNFHLLGMSATPVINNLKEAKSLLEMITGKQYDELNTRRTLNNALESFKHLTLNGLRYKPKYDIVLKNRTGESEANLKIDGTDLLEKLLRIGNNNYLKAEQILLEKKLPSINSLLRKGVIIYSYFTTGMIKVIYDYVKSQGFKVGTFTGNESNEEREANKRDFIDGKLDILIGSKPIGTGVNGLQYISNRMIIFSLPWTDSELTQLKGRIYRQGSKFGEVEVVIPQVYIPIDDIEWSWDLQRIKLIRNKRTLADVAVDGVIPSKTLPSPKTLFKKSQEALKEWKERLKHGDLRIIQRDDLKFPLRPKVTDALRRKLGDFSILNQKWSGAKSENTHQRIKDNPEEWFLYHQLYSEKRETWSEIPFKVIASWITRKEFIVADLGCGQNLLKDEVQENKVYSFDHYAIDESVTACDISSIPLNNASIDISVLCLALMGSNSKDYLREAFRITRHMGYLFVAEPRNKHEGKIDDLTELLKDIGFENVSVEKKENFVYWKCGKL